MNLDALANEAFDHLTDGDFHAARDLYGELLESHPQDPGFQAGYFSAAWWLNRRQAIQLRQPGRDLAQFLFSEWDLFEKQLIQKGLFQTPVLAAVRDSVLGQAAEHFRYAFQQEGASLESLDSLEQLSRCLLRLGDYQNAGEILLYARQKDVRHPAFLFMLAEALSRFPDQTTYLRGLSYFRDACLLDHRQLDFSYIESNPAQQVYQDLLASSSNDLEYVREWFPAHFMIAVFSLGLRQWKPDETHYVLEERLRLQSSLNHSDHRIRERVRAMVAFCLICLWHQALLVNNPDIPAAQNLSEELKMIAPGIWEQIDKQLGD